MWSHQTSYITSLVILSLWGSLQRTDAQSLEYDMVNATSVLGGSPFFSCVSSQLLTGSAKMEFYTVTGQTEQIRGSLNNENTLILPDPVKFNITVSGTTFYFYVKGVTAGDEGMYRCKLDRGGGGTENRDAYLIVSDPPEDADLYWTNRVEKPERGARVELTCSATRSRPPASFRWLKDDGQGNRVDYSYHARSSMSAVDQTGYGTATSVQEMIVTDMDDGTSYKCFVDVPGGEGWHTLERSVDGGIMTSPNLCLLFLVLALSSVGYFR